MSSSAPRHSSASPGRTPLFQVEALARRHFNIDGRASTLSSERDETFLIRDAGGLGYILKIANPDERADILQFQSDAMAHLSDRHLPVAVPRPLLTADGESLVILATGGHRRVMRALTYIEGTLLSSVPRLPGQMRGLGHALAALSNGLADFHPVVPEQDLLWDMCRAARLRELVPYVNADRRPVVLKVLDAYERLKAGRMGELPRQVIHNDFNPHNILVDPERPERVTGIIDFGDMVEAPAINDLAVALSYHAHSGDGFDDVVTVLRAYHEVRPLSHEEFTYLPTLLRTRLAMSIIVSEWRASLHPENSRYLLRNQQAAQGGLLKLSARGDTELATFFERSMGD